MVLPRSSRSSGREAVVGGLTFYEVASITRLDAGIADNVIPDSAIATLNFRYAPDRTRRPADYLRALWSRPAQTLEIMGDSPPALSSRRRRSSAHCATPATWPSSPKQAWTNVADFTTPRDRRDQLRPGRTGYAHRRDEPSRSLPRAARYETL